MMRVKCYADVLGDYVRAGSENCSSQLLAELALSEVDRIRLRVAENPSAPREVLEFLAADKNPDVRVAVGTNISTPVHIKYSFVFDDDANVRLGLAGDMNTPMAVLDKLTEDSNPYVSCRAAETKELIRSQGQAHSFDCHRFFKWATNGSNQSDLQYA